jgi:GNAT superfamily N-acetyltransferase
VHSTAPNLRGFAVPYFRSGPPVEGQLTLRWGALSEDNMTAISARSPTECSAADIAAFKQLVKEGGEVDPATLPALIDRALVLVTAHLQGQLVGVGAIKRPYDGHRARVFEKAKSLLDPTEFEFEFGWFYVRPAARGNGLASKLVQALMPALAGLAAYSTSRTNNVRMHASLLRAGFVPEGAPYRSNLNDQEIQLFICR